MSFLIAFGLAIVLTPIAGWLGRALGLVDRPGELKIHDRAIPLTGGVAVVAASVIAVTVLGRWLPWQALAGVLVAFAAGLIDDVRPLPAWLRLNLQALAGVLVALELQLGPLGAAGTIFAVVATANAVNIIDGQDGLSAGVGTLAALGLAGVLAAVGAPGLGLALALAGALLGFLARNRPPARIFLGNGGAYAVGTLLAALGASAAQTAGWRGLLAAGACLGLLAFEVVFSVARRAWSGSALSGGDRGHSYDLLADRVGRGRSTLLMWTGAAIAAGVGVAAAAWPDRYAAAVLAGGGLLAGVVWVALWRLGRIRRMPERTYGARVVPSGQSGPKIEVET